MRVLVVEDDDAVAEHLEFCLKRLGHTVSQAPDGLAALEYCNAETFDWIICDLRMPRLNGFSFIRNMRRTPTGALSRIIVISNMDDAAIKSEALSIGAEAFFVKPVTAEMLTAALGKPRPLGT